MPTTATLFVWGESSCIAAEMGLMTEAPKAAAAAAGMWPGQGQAQDGECVYVRTCALAVAWPVGVLAELCFPWSCQERDSCMCWSERRMLGLMTEAPNAAAAAGMRPGQGQAPEGEGVRVHVHDLLVWL
jgi:hypothetical protein